jgi:transposase, IS5 family
MRRELGQLSLADGLVASGAGRNRQRERMAALVAADCRRPRKDEPIEGRCDQDATWNAMPETPLFGDKMRLAVDHGSGLVRRAMLTSGHVSDKLPFLDLVQGDERAVYADRGYDGWWYRRELARRGAPDR